MVSIYVCMPALHFFRESGAEWVSPAALCVFAKSIVERTGNVVASRSLSIAREDLCARYS